MGEEKNKRELTYGEKAVGINFNPGGNIKVDGIKKAFAAIIDELWETKENSDNEAQKMLLSQAIVHNITAQMWAVKGITYKD